MLRSILIGTLLLASHAEAQVGYDHAVWDDLAWRERHGTLLFPKSAGPPTRGFDMKYVRCHWTIDPAVRAISGSVTSYFTATQAINEAVFDLSDTLVVDSVVMHGAQLPFTLVAGDVFTITLPATMNAGDLDSLTVTYHGVPRASGFGSFGNGDHNGAPVLWTLSEPYGAKDWWPAKQDLHDKIDSADTYITTPSAYRAAGNGLLVEELVNGPNTTYHWRSRYPIAYYLLSTAVTNYQVITDQVVMPGATVPMITYAYPEDAYIAGLNSGDVLQQMPLYSQLFGLYPFSAEKYGHAQFGWGGGMEHQTMTSVGGYWYELSAHELAHQWFGDKVTCGSWQDIWLNESFATYLQGLCYEYLVPQYWHGYLQSKIESAVSAPDGSVFCTDTTSVGRIFDGRLSYNKGAMVLHMLRWVCGDTAFFHGVRDYLDDPTLAYNSARTSDLKAHLESTSGLNLDEFMADWFTGEGYPTYTMEWAQDAQGNVTVMLDQYSSHPSVSFFEMPVPVRFKNSMLDSTVVLDHTFAGQSFTFNLPFQADSALFDPDLWLISGVNLVTHVPVAAIGSNRPLLFPNPASTDQAWVHLGTAVQGTVRIDVYDALGRAVRSQEEVVSGQRVPLDLVGLHSGSYLAEIDTGGQVLRMRFVKD